MNLRIALPLALLLVSACKPKDEPKDSVPPDETGIPWNPADHWVVGDIVDTEGLGVLATTPGPWGEDLWILRVQGTHTEMGYQYGRLTGPALLDLWWTYMGSLGAKMGADPKAADALLGNLLDQAWAANFEPNVPAMFLEEFQGIADGLEAAGVEYGEGDEDLIKIPIRLVTLIDLAMSSQLDPENIVDAVAFAQDGYTQALLDYYGMGDQGKRAAAAPSQPDGGKDRSPLFNCSYFAAWGDRTDDGGQYMTRNMDFDADSGLNKYGMVAVFVPDGGIPYASISWLGASLGVLAGISEEGIAVSAVGSSSPYERIRTEPAVLRAREVLEVATNLEVALPYLRNEVDDGIIRAPTIGYNALVSWGDPRGDGAAASSAIIETNGLESGVFVHHTDCSVDPMLLTFAYDGSLESVQTPETDPEWVPYEGDAKEIDGDGNIRLFATDGKGGYLLDKSGNYIEDPVKGIPIQTGYPATCALYRGDEAMQYGVRVHQTASNGPAEGGTGLMIQSGSYTKRYVPMRDMTLAYENGSPYTWEEVEVIPDNQGQQVKIGLDQAEAISRVAAMDSNVWDVVYDTTDLVIRVSFESGTGETWLPANEQPSFLEINLADLFLSRE